MIRTTTRGLSDIGVVREENQDSLLIHEPEDPGVRERKGVLIAVADGMGGLEAGSTASSLATEAVLKAYYSAEGPAAAALEGAARAANRAIHERAREGDGHRLMGSTLTALVLVGDGGWIAQVGDSRAYRFRAGKAEQITRDHSLVRELADRGELDENTARYNLQRNVLTRGLGLREDVEIDIYEVRDLKGGDTILLSSDGLHTDVEPEEMAECLGRRGEDLEGACRDLVDLARERGGPDNITVAIARVAAEPAAGSAASAGGDADRTGWLLPLAIFLSFAAGVCLTLWVERPPSLDEAAVRGLRVEVEAALGEARAAGGAVPVQRLRERLERIRDALRQPEK
jgi:protein phosphatase